MDRKTMVGIILFGVGIGVAFTNAVQKGVERYVEKHYQDENDKFILAMKKLADRGSSK